MSIIIINPNSTAAMTTAMCAAARGAAPGLSFDGWTSEDGPPAIQGAEDGATATPPLLDLVRKAGREGAEGIVIEVSFELEPDGSLRSRPRVTATGGDAATRRAYESSASRAVQICAQQGRYRLSAQSYEAWSELTFNFRPGEAY